MWAWRRGDVGMERRRGCDAAAKQSCKKEGRSLVSAPWAKSQERIWPQGAREVLGDLWSSALGVPGRNSSSKRLPWTFGPTWEPPKALPALLAVRLCRAAAARLLRPVQREPGCWLEPPQAPMNPDHRNAGSAETPRPLAHRPGGERVGACTDTCPMRGSPGLRYLPEGLLAL